jgi:hypothetical protein
MPPFPTLTTRPTLGRRLTSLLLIPLVVSCQPEHLSPFPETDVAALPTQLSVAQQHEDIDSLFAGLAATHPALEERLPAARADTLRRALHARVTEPLTRRDFFRLLGAVTADVRDGHGGVLYPYPEFDAWAAGGGRVFPLLVDDLDGRLVVRADRGDASRVPRGATLRRIDGLDTDSLLASFAQYARGETPLLRRQIVAEDFARWLWHLSDASGPWEVEWEHAGGVHRASLEAIALATLERPEEGVASDRPTFRVAEGDVGVLDVPYFGDESAFLTALEQAVDTAAARALAGVVIDLRRNPGGSTDLVEALLSRITSQPCPLVSRVVEKRTARNHRWWWPRGAIGDVVPMDEGTTVAPSDASERFRGRHVILIGPFTYSAAIVMATAAQDCGAAVLVGEPTGGFANQTAQIHFANLPHSKLRWFAPSRMLQRPRGAERGGPVRPDVVVSRAPGDTADTVLARALVEVRSVK